MEQAAALPALGPQLAAGQPPDAAAGQRDQRADARRVEGGRHAVGEKLPAGADRTPGRGRQRPKAEQVEQAAARPRRTRPPRRAGRATPRWSETASAAAAAPGRRARRSARRCRPAATAATPDRSRRQTRVPSASVDAAAARSLRAGRPTSRRCRLPAGPQLESWSRSSAARAAPRRARRRSRARPAGGAGIVEDDGRDLVGDRHDEPLGQRTCPRWMERNDNCGGSGRLDTRLHESAPSGKGGASIGWREGRRPRRRPSSSFRRAR